jgi:hypothetical protein
MYKLTRARIALTNVSTTEIDDVAYGEEFSDKTMA